MVLNCDIYDYFRATGKAIGLVSIPHSGEIIPADFVPYLLADSRSLAEDVDYQVNQLIDIKKLTEAGVDVLVAKIHRTCVDLNRPKEMAVLNWKQNSQGVKIVVAEPEMELYESLQQKYYKPYFDALRELIDRIDPKPVAVIDFHSMPSAPTAYHLKQNPNQKRERPDFCISDLKGISCSADFIGEIVASFRARGFDATSNDPYFGGHVTKFINQFETNNVQIETKRSLYMDESERVLFDDKVEELRSVITEIFLNTFIR